MHHIYEDGMFLYCEIVIFKSIHNYTLNVGR